jgi:hypothetical protein
MSDWGKVVYNKDRGHYAVIGEWQGKRVYLSQYQSQVGAVTCKTKQQAEQLRMVCNSHIDQRIFNPDRFKRRKPSHIKAYALSWLEIVRANISYATYKSYRACIKHHIIPGIGHIFLPDLNYEKILKWINKTSRSLKTKKNIHGVLAKMLRDAEKSGHISQVPNLVSFTGGLSIPSSDPEWIDFETQSRITEYGRPRPEL